ncbi:MAG: acyl-CoA dehydrogenase family protein [Rhizorhabdus sp.]
MTLEIEAYRDQARIWLENQIPQFGRDARKGLSEGEDLALARRWQTVKYDAGYAAISWPKDHCGQGLSLLHRLAFEQEEIKHGFPNDYFGVSLGMPVPIVLRHQPGEWTRERAKAALRGEEIWCQLFSEPAGGYDLAGLRARAELDPSTGDWIVNGQKLWTTWAQYSDYGVIVVRTDPSVPKHKGLTYFWVDMKAAGVTVRPVRLAEGRSEVNEVFFDDVRIPDSQRLGAVGGGFGVAMETLTIERYQATDPAGFGPPLQLFIDEAKNTQIRGKPAIEDGRVRERIARTYAMQSAMGAIYQRTLLSLAAGLQPGPEGAVHKLVSVRARQKLSEFAIDLQGVQGMRFDESLSRKESWAKSWLTAPTGRIAGGADEMLLNTIAEKILGLPQDHRPDKGVPFNQIPH